jgi:phospholipid/cholesterol/gamma-HCH transport system substrate-binding protein
MRHDALRVGPSAVKLALFMVVTAVAFGLLATTIANVRWGPKADYTAVFTDATGLDAGDDVRVGGVRVGEVTGVKVNDAARAVVSFRVDRQLVLTKGTQAVIRYRNLIGQRYLALNQGQGEPEKLPIGGEIPLDRTRPALDLTVLFNGFKPLFAALDPHEVNTLAYEIITVLQGEGGTVQSLLAHTASLTSDLADRDEVIGRTIDNLDEVLGVVAERADQLDTLIIQLQRLVAGLAADREAIGGSIGHIADLADSTAGLIGEARPAVREDIAQLGDLATLLNTNSADIERFLDTWPGKISTITRTATYGSWFNFYLCDFDGHVVLPTGSQPIPAYSTGTARCR